MTRINANLVPSELINKHLMAEYFEIRRVRHYKPDENIKTFRLGKGHVKFYSTHKSTTIKRLQDISEELLKRGLVTQQSIDSTFQLFQESWGNVEMVNIYEYSPEENDMLRLRLMSILENKIYKKRGTQKYGQENIKVVEAINLLQFETEAGKTAQSSIISKLLFCND
jgi:hypothetical protein